MRMAMAGLLMGVALSVCALGGALAIPTALAQPQTSAPAAATALQAFTSAAGEHRQLLLVVDPATRVVGVYHVDAASGEIALKSVRNIHSDLELLDYNGTAPSPLEIRSMLERAPATALGGHRREFP